jgi:hypothetical protein
VSTTASTELAQWSATIGGLITELDRRLSPSTPTADTGSVGVVMPGRVIERSLTLNLEEQLALVKSEGQRCIDAVRLLRLALDSSKSSPPTGETWTPVSSVPEQPIAIPMVGTGRVLKRDYNYFDALNAALQQLAEKEQKSSDPLPVISPY